MKKIYELPEHLSDAFRSELLKVSDNSSWYKNIERKKKYIDPMWYDAYDPYGQKEVREESLEEIIAKYQKLSENGRSSVPVTPAVPKVVEEEPTLIRKKGLE